MKFRNMYFVLLLLGLIMPCSIQIDAATQDLSLLAQKITLNGNAVKRTRGGKKTVSLSYEDEDLVNIINYLSALRNVNVVLPIGANAINVKVTLDIKDKLSITEAWDILITLLDLAGYSLFSKENVYSLSLIHI